MNILFLSNYGNNLSLAYKLSEEGHNSIIYIKKNPIEQEKRKGIQFINSWRPYLKSTDLVICDGDDFGVISEKFLSIGKPVLFSSKEADLFNSNEKLLEQLLIDNDINNKDIGSSLRFNVHVFFNGREFINPIFYSFEENGNVIVLSSTQNRIQEDILNKMNPIISKCRYKGLVNIDLSINEYDYCVHKVYLGMNSVVDVLSECLNEKLIDVLFELSTGIKKYIKTRKSVLIKIPLMMPQISIPIKINGINEHNKNHIAFNSIFNKDDSYYYNSLNKKVLSATARGNYIAEARKRAYRTINNIKINGCSYKENVGLSSKKQWEKLQEIVFL